MASASCVTNVSWSDFGTFTFKGKVYLYMRAHDCNDKLWQLARYIMYMYQHAYTACQAVRYLTPNDVAKLLGHT